MVGVKIPTNFIKEKTMDPFYKLVPNAPQKTLFDIMRNRCHGPATLAIHGTTKTNITTVAFNFEIGGRMLSKAAVTAGTAVAGGTIAAGRAALLAMLINASGTFSFQLGDSVAAADVALTELPEFANTLCCVGAVKIVNGTASVFTLGTTALDATDVTTTYYNFGNVLPGEVI